MAALSAGRRYRRAVKRRTLYLLPDIPDDSPTAYKNALAARNEATLTGICPECGSKCDPFPPFQPGTVYVVNFGHEPNCRVLLGAFQ